MTIVTDGSEFLFVTANAHKLEEANLALAQFGLHLKMARVEKVEIQADRLDAIASYAARLAAERSGKAVVCEDSGLFIKALSGFPGPYSSYAFKTIGCNGVLRLMEGAADRRGSFQSAVSFCRPGSPPITFMGTTEGSISEGPRGSAGFGYDPIFAPTAGDGRTFAEMEIAEKGRLSHRGKAFRRFALWASGMAKLK
jgi:XTP/dITP diphosphohydrolase